MAKKKDFVLNQKKNFGGIKSETLRAIFAIFSFLLTLLSIMSAFGKAGMVGEYSFVFLSRLFGIGYYLIPIILIMMGIASLRGIDKKFGLLKTGSAFVFFVSGLGLIHVISNNSGGIVGKWISIPFLKLIDIWATTALLLALAIACVFVIFEAHITGEQLKFWKWFKRQENKINTEIDEREEEKVKQAMMSIDGIKTNPSVQQGTENNKMQIKKGDKIDFDDSGFTLVTQAPLLRPFNPPPLSLLEKDSGKPETGDIKANANIIKRTLQNFGITVEMDEISIGPSVTRYALKPAEGVKLSRIVALNNDLSLALAAHPIRIEAPIPGKSLVGIEVPNTAKTTVGLATILGSSNFKDSEKPLLVSLGKDITGLAHFCNLGKAPHMLIAGATGSGKSVAIHALITSLLYRNSPDNLKLILIDPKRVELTMYNKIPHLLTPVITDPKKAILALKWAAKEMSRRYDVLEKNAARDIDSYHRNILIPAIKKNSNSDSSSLPETMPYIAIIIDELADIMQAYPRELESAIVRLAQMSRAVGIHLVLSTQRPSVNVITGLIKANIPTRVAMQVASQIDSRTILDQMGAEKLLGAGDMLYLGAEMSKPIRLQSAFISETEVKHVVKYLADQYRDEIMSEINLTPGDGSMPASGAVFDAMLDSESLDDGDGDDLYEGAREVVLAAGKASTSYLQRKLGVGYSRAAKLMDMLEEKGVIGPANGSKPRDVMGVSEENIETNAIDSDDNTETV
ncbi:MAG: DNA translocase FtsK [Candidatus Paceibacterota bacterium]|jgi:S-DNA-T family DNA segregation ATPase FtsK/SpoIIIE